MSNYKNVDTKHIVNRMIRLGDRISEEETELQALTRELDERGTNIEQELQKREKANETIDAKRLAS